MRQDRVSHSRTALPRQTYLGFGLLLLAVILALSLMASLALGAADISPASVWQALFFFDNSTEHLIIRTVRLPRSLVALLVGAALGVAGAIMQGLTRNPLADPGILGINAGAALTVVGTVFFLGPASASLYTWSAFAGAGLAAVAVYGLGSLGRSGLTPLNLTIAGAALTAFLSSLTTALLLLSQRTLEEIRFWLAGSVAGRDLVLVGEIFPYVVLGMLAAILLSKQITILSLGDEVATGLGQKTLWIKTAAAAVVVVLAGSSVAAAGPIGFVGLVIPHIIRILVGVDYRWILPYSAVAGGILLLVSDIAARLLIRPQELPVGIMTALVGAPVFLYLARWKIKK
ncbi:MAG: iron ABC transporter permease [Synechococcaceae cyanobacterium SM2_3_1]|nr:iron ABC transporter permease [Synechococcaceae cyanobacterium SM2_3_1]